jgi:hypothetical protein
MLTSLYTAINNICIHREWGMLLKYSIHKTLTELFLIPWHISQNRYTGMVERTTTCDPQVERETLQVYSYTPRVLSFVPQSAFGPKLDRTHDRRRPGADPLASKIAWPNAKRYVKDSPFLLPLPQDLPQLRRRIEAAISDIDVTCYSRFGWKRIIGLTSAVSLQYIWGMEKKEMEFLFPSVTFYNPFRSSSVPILWSMSGKYESNCSLHHSPAVMHSCCYK